MNNKIIITSGVNEFGEEIELNGFLHPKTGQYFYHGKEEILKDNDFEYIPIAIFFNDKLYPLNLKENCVQSVSKEDLFFIKKDLNKDKNNLKILVLT